MSHCYHPFEKLFLVRYTINSPLPSILLCLVLYFHQRNFCPRIRVPFIHRIINTFFRFRPGPFFNRAGWELLGARSLSMDALGDGRLGEN